MLWNRRKARSHDPTVHIYEVMPCDMQKSGTQRELEQRDFKGKEAPYAMKSCVAYGSNSGQQKSCVQASEVQSSEGSIVCE